MMKRYAVIGHPVAHSQSPLIHTQFAEQTGCQLSYERLLAPLEGFEVTARQFFDDGGSGLNVTVPFKQAAWRLVDAYGADGDALMAEAVNTIVRVADTNIAQGYRLLGHNTDGYGLVTDIECNIGVCLGGARVLLLGAGGAAYGVMLALLRSGPQHIVVANRTLDKAQALVGHFAQSAQRFAVPISADAYPALTSSVFDVVINATSAGLQAQAPAIPPQVFAPQALAYEMVYGRVTPFMQLAQSVGVRAVAGWGMLVEQAAEAFRLWHGVRPVTDRLLQYQEAYKNI